MDKLLEQLRFVPPPVNKKLELDSVGRIHCKAQGTPPPIIRWEKDGISSENFPGHISDVNGTLHFNRVTANDKGKYNCIASNSQGTINASITIDVVGKIFVHHLVKGSQKYLGFFSQNL